jgi:hypothetical protein
VFNSHVSWWMWQGGKRFDSFITTIWICNLAKATLQRKNKNVKYLRQYVFDYYKTHGCIDCGETDPIVLEFDHVTGDNVSNIAFMVHSNTSISTLVEEIEKCVVRCANCHRRKTAKDQNWYKDLKTDSLSSGNDKSLLSSR